MSFSLGGLFSKKNLNLVVGLITLLVALYVVMIAVPELFYNMFNTLLGNLLLAAFILLAVMYDTNLGIGLAIVVTVLYRFSHYGQGFMF